jgi:predicted helicase
VDTALREELDIPDGLADPRVFVLDPCCGTGAYLVEVLRRIEKTMKEKGEVALSALDIKEAAQKRVFGFEIMPAPFVVAHLQMGLLLQNLAVPLDDSKNERAGIFLTNSLTGWDFAGENPKLANWPELEAERVGAGRVKQEKPILVILGNPPYNAYAGISPEEEQGLVEPYKEGLVKKWGIKKFNLDDLYVRFFRLAERRIAEKTGKGIVCFISNFSYLSDPSFVVMRQRFLQEFDSLWFDCLNGDSRETGKLTPEGKPDPSVFSTEYNREGIRIGTAIGLLVRKTKRDKKPQVFFRHFWGVDKRAAILASLKVRSLTKQYEKADPIESNRLSFRVSDVGADYLRWPAAVELCEENPISGLQEMRHSAFLDINREYLAQRMMTYFDPAIDWEAIKALKSGLTEKAGGFAPAEARKKALSREIFDPNKLRRYALYPFDNRWCYYTEAPALWNRPRPELVAQCWKGNRFFVTRMFAERPHEQIAMTMTTELPDYHLLRPNAVAIPLRLRTPAKERSKAKDDGNGEFSSILHEASPAYRAASITGNLSAGARGYLAKLGIKNLDAQEETASLIWMHALAIGYSAAYLLENADGVRQDWPRIPLPESRSALLASAALGRKVATLLDTDTKLTGVDSGNIRPELMRLAVVTKLTKGPLNLSLTVGWGHGGKGGVTMPGRGKLETRSCAADEVPRLLGQSTHDVYLNNSACWSNVPEKIWDYTIGGYRVIKKWLSYREFQLLGRGLTPDEAREVTHMARRIAALILLQPELDANYLRVKANTFDWKA